MRTKQANCNKCGPVLAQTSDPMAQIEQMQGCLLVFLTCGIALPFVLLHQIRRDRESKTFRCPNCGQQLK